MITYYKLKSDYEYDVTKNASLTGLEVDKNFKYLEDSLISSIEATDKGFIITKYDGTKIICEDVITKENILKHIPETKVYTDNTINGNGSEKMPLSLSSSMKPGCIKPVNEVYADESELPTKKNKIGDRYICLKSGKYNINGKLYNLNAVKHIIELLKKEDCGWRVATKRDWDGMLNALETKYKTHDSKKCNVLLGREATDVLFYKRTDFNILTSPKGSDKNTLFGYAYDEGKTSSDTHVVYEGLRTGYWTATAEKGLDGELLNAYIKRFDRYDDGVYQDIVDGTFFYSLRLVKDINGKDIPDSVDILGNKYPVVVMPNENDHAAMWTALNLNYYSDKIKNNVVTFDNDKEASDPVIYVNEWDGEKWNKFKVDPYTLFYNMKTNEFLYLAFDENGELTVKGINDEQDSRIESLLKKIEHLEELHKDYMYFENAGTERATIVIKKNGTPDHELNLETSVDKYTWIKWNIESGKQIAVGKKLYVRSSENIGYFNNDISNYYYFSSDKPVNAGGNIMSLGYKDFENEYLIPKNSICAYAYLFKNMTELNDIRNLSLPATIFGYGANQVYRSMFEGCTNIRVAPELPAVQLEIFCYYEMFKDCTSLTVAPEILPSTELKPGCYNSMFSGCTSLEKAPELPAIDAAEYCYNEMFNGCSSLNYIKAMFTSRQESDIWFTTNWVNGVSSTGTFVKNKDAQWDITGNNGIPSGWTVQNI